jgi:hypothetical protein
MIFSASRPKTYKFVDENKRMVAPAAPFPYISELFSDFFIQLKKNWYSFCIQNNSYSEQQPVSIELGIKLDGMDDYVPIHYKETKCFPVFKEDVFYSLRVSVSVPKEELDKHFKFEGDYYKMEGTVSYKAYSKLTPFAMIIIYLLFFVATYGGIKILISMYKLIVLLKV